MEPDKSDNPQVRRTHELMLDAAAGLLAKVGPEAVTHLHVAEKAGVARTTVYRHWPTRADILVELLRRGAGLHLEPPSTDSPIEQRIAGILGSFAASLKGAGGQTLSAMIGLAEWDEEVFNALERMTQFGPRMLKGVITAGIEQGELSPETDVDLLADRLIGPLYLRRLMYHDDLTDSYVERLVSTTLASHLSM